MSRQPVEELGGAAEEEVQSLGEKHLLGVAVAVNSATTMPSSKRSVFKRLHNQNDKC